jgi:hypothetical protein
MDSQEEIRSAVLAVLNAHVQMRADYLALLNQLHANKTTVPHIGLMLQQHVPDERKTLLIQEESNAASLETALNSNQPFAALLQAYAELWAPSLDDSIRHLNSGFQQKTPN